MASLDFIKMQGAGNDFVIVDRRASQNQQPALSAATITALSDRHFGVGCDLICVVDSDPDHDAMLTFFNADGGESSACGNATRCIAHLFSQGSTQTAFLFRTRFGTLSARCISDGTYTVNMGQPEQHWSRIPLARDVDVDALPIDGAPGAVSMGNPHMVFLVDDAEQVDVAARGAALELHPLFPERTNVEFCTIRDDGSVRMRVWERGVGITLACGSGACASLVVLARRGLIGRRADLVLDGGTLDIDWRDDGVWMTGPARTVFHGTIDIA